MQNYSLSSMSKNPMLLIAKEGVNNFSFSFFFFSLTIFGFWKLELTMLFY